MDSVEDSIATLKQRAEAAIPTIRRRIQAWNEGNGAPGPWSGTLKYGVDAPDRNALYTTMWHQLEPNNGRFWFQAATMVTGGGGIKSMDSWIASTVATFHIGPVHRSDMKFIIAGNKFLFPFNLCNYYTLLSHQSIPGFPHMFGRDLDRALVVLEQTLVQKFLEAYGWESPSEKTAALARLSGAFTSWVSNDWVTRTVSARFPSNRPFNFGSLDHRIELGIELVDRLRKNQ